MALSMAQSGTSASACVLTSLSARTDVMTHASKARRKASLPGTGIVGDFMLLRFNVSAGYEPLVSSCRRV